MSNIAVIGADDLGVRIARLAVTHGCTVFLVDHRADAQRRAIETIRDSLDRLIRKDVHTPANRDDILSRLHTCDSIADVSDVRLVVEAVDDNPTAKKRVLRAMAEALPAHVVIATTTSLLSVRDLAESVGDPDRVVGMHFPGSAVPGQVVEIVTTGRKQRRSVDTAVELVRAWEQTPVCVKDAPGFLVSRIACGFFNESLRVFDEGIAGIDEIDAVLTSRVGFPMGPFALMDLLGLDVQLSVGASIWERTGRPDRLRPHGVQRDLVKSGHLGRKTGRGFYQYTDNYRLPACVVDRKSFTLDPLLADAVIAFAARAGAVTAAGTEQYVLARVLAAAVNEAGFVFTEDVSTSGDIDVALTEGLGFPKGPLAWADEIGHRTVAGVLRALDRVLSDSCHTPASLFAG